MDNEKLNGIYFFAEPCYLNRTNAVSLIRENDLVLVAADGYITRRIISERCCELENVTAISGNNFLTDGGIRCHVRRKGINVTLPFANEFTPEIAGAKDEDHPDFKEGRTGCETQVKRQPQLVVTNFAVASAMLNACWAFLEDKLDYDNLYLDVPLNTVTPEWRTHPKEFLLP